jgi:cell division protein FtsB
MTTETFGMFFVLGILALITTLIVVVVWQTFVTWRARMSVEREEAYRKLADQATSALQKTAEEQEKIGEGMEELRTRVAAIERMLREVA